jgi:hypothetical protein
MTPAETRVAYWFRLAAAHGLNGTDDLAVECDRRVDVFDRAPAHRPVGSVSGVEYRCAGPKGYAHS